MRRKKPRSRIEIYADIVLALDRAGSCDRLSRLALMVGVPYDRLLRYLSELRRLGLVRWDPYHGVSLTNDGVNYVIRARGDRDTLVTALTALVQGVTRAATED